MKCEKGSVMLEMLVSLILLMMVASLIFPQTLLIMKERKNIQMKYKAQVLLQEEAALYLYENGEMLPKVKEEEGITYMLRWEDEKVCVLWEDVRQHEMKRCRYVEK
ncbi:competence protein ComG [Bacillus manliponensis]|uniref:Competence protein ComG n=1 Tax=Bacillus manliponensis TaxID=574376 RepID=A0A073JZ83_9BACI|nr:type II secretion system protein [Bacillus manliponensis]KEK19555.1 competence protein ComG [Bacillus manliponensis]